MQNKIFGGFIQVSYSEREVLFSSRVFMKLFKALFFFLLLGGDYGLELASLEAFPTQVLGCDGHTCQPVFLFVQDKLLNFAGLI